MGFLIFIRNDKWLPPSPLMAGNVGEEKCPPLSGCRERGRRRKAGEDCLSGASSAAPGSERSGRQEYPITGGRPFLVTSLRRERSYGTLSFWGDITPKNLAIETIRFAGTLNDGKTRKKLDSLHQTEMTIIRIETDNTDIHAYNHHRILYLLVFKKGNDKK